MAFNPKLTDEYIRFLNWKLELVEGKHNQDEFKFNHNFIRRLDAVTNKVAKKRGFNYNKDYDFNIDHNIVNVTFPGGKVSLEYPVELLWEDDKLYAYMNGKV